MFGNFSVFLGVAILLFELIFQTCFKFNITYCDLCLVKYGTYPIENIHFCRIYAKLPRNTYDIAVITYINEGLRRKHAGFYHKNNNIRSITFCLVANIVSFRLCMLSKLFRYWKYTSIALF